MSLKGKKWWRPVLLATLVALPNESHSLVRAVTGEWTWGDVLPGVLAIDALTWLVAFAVFRLHGEKAGGRSVRPGPGS